jgi:hypothetical protein
VGPEGLHGGWVLWSKARLPLAGPLRLSGRHSCERPSPQQHLRHLDHSSLLCTVLASPPPTSPNIPRPCARPHAQVLSPLAIGGILGVKALGYLMFRGANSQKDIFRRDPTHPRVARLRTLKTERGTQLIVSGWWGIARHINYFGDWLMA